MRRRVEPTERLAVDLDPDAPVPDAGTVEDDERHRGSEQQSHAGGDTDLDIDVEPDLSADEDDIDDDDDDVDLELELDDDIDLVVVNVSRGRIDRQPAHERLVDAGVAVDHPRPRRDRRSRRVLDACQIIEARGGRGCPPPRSRCVHERDGAA